MELTGLARAESECLDSARERGALEGVVYHPELVENVHPMPHPARRKADGKRRWKHW